MPPEQSFEEFLIELHNGSNQAAAEVCRRYGERLWAHAKLLLRRSLRAQLDPEDVLQSVYKPVGVSWSWRM